MALSLLNGIILNYDYEDEQWKPYTYLGKQMEV